MKVPPLSERPVTEEEEQAVLAPPSRRKKRSLAATRAALRPWVIGIGLTVLVAVAAVAAYTLAAGIASWNENPSAAATPKVHPAPAPTVSSEPAMSGGYEIGPTGPSYAQPSSRQIPTRSPNYPRQLRKTPNEAQNSLLNTTWLLSATRGTRVTHRLWRACPRRMSRLPMGTLMPSIRFTRTVGHTGILQPLRASWKSNPLRQKWVHHPTLSAFYSM